MKNTVKLRKLDSNLQLTPLLGEILSLIVRGIYVNQEVYDDFYPIFKDQIDKSLEKREETLLNPEKVVCSSINNGDKEVNIERDKKFYCLQFANNSTITPAYIVNSLEFKEF